MTDPLRQFQPGERFVPRANTLNAFVEAARAYRDAPADERPGDLATNARTILVKNETGETLSRGAAVGLDVPIILPADNEPEFARRIAFRGIVPEAGVHEGKWAVLAEPIGDGRIGRAWAAGVFPSRINVEADHEALERCDIESGETRLRMDGEGAAHVLWKEEGTGMKWAVVRLDGRAGTGGAECDPRNELWIISLAGSPTGGAFDLDVTINGVTETLTIGHDATAEEVEAAFESHSEIGSGDVSVADGPLPDVSVAVQFTGKLAARPIVAPGIDSGGLTGGSTKFAFVARYRPGGETCHCGGGEATPPTPPTGRIYTSDGTWNKPEGLSHVVVEVQGGGGGGGGSGSNGAVAGGGGGGGYAKKIIAADELGDTETVTIGDGGARGEAGNNAGSNGGTSSFGSHVSATGGTGGQAGNGSAGLAPGGNGSGGDVHLPGQSGGTRLTSNAITTTAGGSSFMGYGGIPVGTSGDSGGLPGTGYGGGGGGGKRATVNVVGGHGSQGIVIVTEHHQ